MRISLNELIISITVFSHFNHRAAASIQASNVVYYKQGRIVHRSDVKNKIKVYSYIGTKKNF